MTRFISRHADFLLILLPLLLAGAVRGEIALISDREENNRQVLELVFRAAPADASGVLSPDVSDFPEAAWSAPLPQRSEPASSSLLIVPADAAGYYPGSWEVETAGLAAGVSLRPANVSGVEVLQVTATAQRTSAGGTTRITLRGPGTAAKAPRRPLPEAVARFVANAGRGEPLRAKATKGTPSPLPAPDGPLKARYAVAEGDLPATLVAADLPTTDGLRVTWKGFPVPLIAGSNDFLLYAPFNATRTAVHDALFITPGAADPSPAMATRDAFPTLAPSSAEQPTTRTLVHDPDLFYERSAGFPAGQRFVQYRLFTNQSRDTTIPFPDRLTGATITADFTLSGASSNFSLNPDHYAEITLDGDTAPAPFSWEGRVTADFTHVFTPTSPLAGAGGETITFGHAVPQVPGGPPSEVQNLDAFTLTYAAKPRVGPDGVARLDLQPSPDGQPRLVTIGGFPPGTIADDLLLLDVTLPFNPVRITGASTFIDETGTVAVEFEAPATAASFHAEVFAEGDRPLTVTPSKSLATPTTVVEGIVVSPEEYHATLAPLLALRGPGWILLDPEAAYDSIDFGQQSPDVIREALRLLLEAAPGYEPFPAILLVGYASLDWRNALGTHDAPQVPTFIEIGIDTGFTIENSVDFPYGVLFGLDDLPDAAVGRLPVKSVAELENIVDRLVAHEAAGETLRDHVRPGLFIYDNVPEILADAGLLEAIWDDRGHPAETITFAPATDGSAEQAALFAALDAPPAGPALVVYTGHGNNTVWADERLLEVPDLDLLNHDGSWPLVTTFTCLNGYYAFPGSTVRSMGEEWLLRPSTRGAVATIVPVGVDYYNNQRLFTELMIETVSADPANSPDTIGEALAWTRLQFALENPTRRITLAEYNLFGDPATDLTLQPHPLTGFTGWMILEE